METLSKLRNIMKAQGIDAYIVTGADAHGSDYVTDYWKTRAWLTGFTGSAGMVVVTQDKAGLWTDGRYFLQAEKELTGTGFTLYKMEEPNVPTYQQFLKDEVPAGGRVAFDGRTLPLQSYETIRKQLKEKDAAYECALDLVGNMWSDRPAMPQQPAFAHEIKFAGLSAGEKLASVRTEMKKKEIGGYLVTALDDIAWLLNIRGNDVPFTPVVYAYAFITHAQAHVFVDPDKVRGIPLPDFTLHPYEGFINFLRNLQPKDVNGGKLYINANKANMLINETLPKSIPVNRNVNDDILPLMKAKKSDGELANIRNAYKKEGVVLVRLLMWLEAQLAAAGELTLHEGDITCKLRDLRSTMPDYIQDSFSTIAAYGANAASAHYSPGEQGAKIERDGLLLIDTGGNYMDGTTDTTRTIPVGALTDEMRRDYTLVLKGHIALAVAQFPEGTTGSQIDVLARLPLWLDGKNFRHGTGHGIGYALCVHEGPHNIAHRHNAVALTKGMLVSNEPGMYKDNHYGIRTENILCVKELEKTEYGQFYGFESLTFCPINICALDRALLTDTERTYLNAYHKATYNALAPMLTPEEQTWLKSATQEV
ncbi:MAG: aminopeptidase P family N-terminal domain-containing protein [Defluviitaleaceae bacterium]|nr:aminopeptidase P family N-terminal domain-containing protein [Defluviitaleaceae bacterium]MCL2275706.1 aminopeptidase P family N-terminal domain-containing protein [Defluviitaleaceae bacterium]